MTSFFSLPNVISLVAEKIQFNHFTHSFTSHLRIDDTLPLNAQKWPFRLFHRLAEQRGNNTRLSIQFPITDPFASFSVCRKSSRLRKYFDTFPVFRLFSTRTHSDSVHGCSLCCHCDASVIVVVLQEFPFCFFSLSFLLFSFIFGTLTLGCLNPYENSVFTLVILQSVD